MRSRLLRVSSVSRSQIKTVPIESTEAKYSPLGSEAIPIIGHPWPCNLQLTEPSLMWILVITQSSPPTTKKVPDLQKDKAWMFSKGLLLGKLEDLLQ